MPLVIEIGLGPGDFVLDVVESDVDRVELFRLTLRFFDDVSTAS